MMPIDTRVIRHRADTDDRAAAKALLMALISAETAGEDVIASGGASNGLALTPALNKVLQNALSVIACDRPLSIIVLNDDDLLDTGTAAEILGYGAVWISKMVKNGQIETHKHRAGRKHLVPARAVVDRIAADPQGHAKRMAAAARPKGRRGRKSLGPRVANA